MRRFVSLLGVAATLLAGCGGHPNETTTNPAQKFAALASKAGGSLKAADAYARSQGQPSDCPPASSGDSTHTECIYSAAFVGCITALRKTDRSGYTLLFTEQGKLSSREKAVFRQAIQDCSRQQ